MCAACVVAIGYEIPCAVGGAGNITLRVHCENRGMARRSCDARYPAGRIAIYGDRIACTVTDSNQKSGFAIKSLNRAIGVILCVV